MVIVLTGEKGAAVSAPIPMVIQADRVPITISAEDGKNACRKRTGAVCGVIATGKLDRQRASHLEDSVHWRQRYNRRRISILRQTRL